MAVTGTATAGADTLRGDDANDLIRAGKGNDRIFAGGGRDTIWGEDGNDTIDGGTGTDLAAYLGKVSTYQIIRQPDGVSWTVKSTAKNGPTDLLTNVERLQFDDRIVLLSPDAAPIAVADTATMNEDGAAITLDVGANDTDADRDALSLASIRTVTGGTATIVNGRIVFTADANFSGTATITYVVTESLGSLPVYDTDGNAVAPRTAEGTVSITVNPVNDAPTAPATRSISATEDLVTVAIAIGAADLDGDALAYATKVVAGQLTKGTVVYNQAAGTFTYTPIANANGTDSFTVLISDGKGGTAEQVVNMTIAAVNDAPTASATRSVTITEDRASAFVAIGATDVDSDALSYATKSIPGQLIKGTVAYANGGFIYTPNANANGSESFTILISDGKGGTTEQLVTVGITPVNDAPTGQPTIAGTAKVGQTLTASAAGLGDADGLGTVTFTWQMQDGAQWTSLGTGATHAIGSGEIGKMLRVVASYTDGGGTQESVTSASTLVGSGLQMTDSVIYSSVQYDGIALGYGFNVQLRSTGAFGTVTYAILANPDVGGTSLIAYFDPAGSGYLTANVGNQPAGTTTTATLLATDGSGGTDDGTLTLHRITANLQGFSLSGGAGDDVFLLPSGGGTVWTGEGTDVVFASGTTGHVLVQDSGGESLMVQVASMTGDLNVASGAERLTLMVQGLDGVLTLRGTAPVNYAILSGLTNGLSLTNVQGLQAHAITGDVSVALAQGGSASVEDVTGNVTLTGEGSKSVSDISGFAFLSGGGTLAVENIGGTATLMGAEAEDTLRAAHVQGSAALDGRGGHDWYEGSGADAATGVHSFESFVLRAGEVDYDYIAGFDGVAGGSGDKVMLVNYGRGSLTLESTTTVTLFSWLRLDPVTGSYIYGPMLEYVSEKVWRIDGTEDRFRTLANTWQTSSGDPVNGGYVWTWHVDSENFDPLADVVWA